MNQATWFWASLSLAAGTLVLTATGHMTGTQAAEVISAETAVLRIFCNRDSKDGQSKED